MCQEMRVVFKAKDLELCTGLVLALQERGLLRDGNKVAGILESLEAATPVPELPQAQGTVAF